MVDPSVDEAPVDDESVDEAVLLVLAALEVLEVLEVLLLAACGGGGGMPPFCCETEENRSPRNCCSAALIALEDELLVESVAEAVELESLLEDDDEVLELVELLAVPTPIWASADAIAATSGFVLALSVEVDALVLVCDS